MGIIYFVFGVVCYLGFFATFLYSLCFVGNMTDIYPGLVSLVPKTIDRGGEQVSTITALIINMCLLSVFAVQHSVMARPAFKKIWTKIIPTAIERSIYVLLSSLALILIFHQWRPMLAPIWNFNGSAIGTILCILFVVGWATVLISTFLINHFELFGLKQVFCAMRGKSWEDKEFKTPFFYKYVRHPIYFGFVMAFWATPEMSAGHLLFAIGTTGYILLGIFLEERDLIDTFGNQYREYKKKVSMLIPWPPRS